jgi:excisionase family DNA binding protein
MNPVSGSVPPPLPDHQGIARMALSPDEAAKALGVSRSFFFAEILPALAVVRVGRRRLVPVRELERWLNSSSQQALPR